MFSPHSHPIYDTIFHGKSFAPLCRLALIDAG